MPITIDEKVESRESTEGKDASVDLLYVVQGTDDDAAVKTLVEATVPAFYQGLVIQDYHINHLGGGVWDVSVRYGTLEFPKPGDNSFSFETGGGTQHITQSIETVNKYAPPGKVAPDFKGAIGVTHDSVEGSDIAVPVYNFVETYYMPIALVTAAYKVALFNLTGRVNDAVFKGFAIGECLFQGASGSRRGQDDWEITFRFAALPNAVNLQVGDIVVAEKKGWEYLWVRYADAVDENVLVKQPIAAYVEKLYELADFSLLGIGV